MPEKEIISLDQAQMAAERFVEGQFKNLKKIGVDKVKLGSIGSILIYDIDGIINSAPTVAALHDLGKHVVCYVEVGAAGNYYSAADERTIQWNDPELAIPWPISPDQVIVSAKDRLGLPFRDADIFP